MTDPRIVQWLVAFLFTQAIEIPLYMYALRVRPFQAFLASALTHPVVWFVIPPVFDELYLAVIAPHPALWITARPRYWVMVAIAEVFAVAVEALYLRRVCTGNTLRWSVLANAASFTLGIVRRSLLA
jgi:hypothetical protein